MSVPIRSLRRRRARLIRMVIHLCAQHEDERIDRDGDEGEGERFRAIREDKKGPHVDGAKYN